MTREFRVFATAVAGIALHVMVDGVVAPEPGTSATDHIVPLGVTLGTLLLATVLYPTWRPGLRGIAALGLGALSLEGFAIATSSATAQGPRGDDWTGFLLLPVGLALCGVGVMLLWSSRKPRGRRFLRRALVLAVAVVGVYVFLVPIAVAILATHRPREVAVPTDLGRPDEVLTIRTSDSLELEATYVGSRNGAAVIVYPASASREAQARILVRHGYGVLMLQMRGYGASEGDPNMFGWGATRDLDAAIVYLEQRPDVDRDRIGGLGFSVGGEQMLDAAAGNPGLRAVASEGAGERSIREALLRGPKGWPSIPMEAVQTAAVMVLSGHLPPPAITHVIRDIAPRPVYLIYAGRGTGGEELQPDFAAAAGDPKALWRIPEAQHTGGYEARPREYERRIVGFFDDALLRSATGSNAGHE